MTERLGKVSHTPLNRLFNAHCCETPNTVTLTSPYKLTNTWADETRLVLLAESPQATETFFPAPCAWSVLYATAHKRTHLCSLEPALIYLAVCWTAPFPGLMMIIGWLWARQLFLQLWNLGLNSRLHAASLADRKEALLRYWCLISPMQRYPCQSEIVLSLSWVKFLLLIFPFFCLSYHHKCIANKTGSSRTYVKPFLWQLE